MTPHCPNWHASHVPNPWSRRRGLSVPGVRWPARRALALVVAGSVVAGLLGARLLAVGAEPPGGGKNYFRIRVVDDQTGRGVPLVELKTVDNVKYYTDSAGLVAFDEPAQMNREVFFAVASHGYEMPADGFGIRGKILQTAPGEEAEIRIKRLNIAERLYRVTGAGIYRDTILAGGKAPLAEPLLNAQVVGSDSVQTAIYRGQLWWFWGDTNRPKYPLGNFHVPGASSKLPTDGGLAPEVGVDLNYLVNEEGFARATCQMEGDGPTWIDALTVVAAADGSEQMFAGYMKVRKLLEVYRRGIARWDAAAHKFVHAADIPLDAPALPHGHALRVRDGGAEYVYFGNPFPLTRVPATAEALLDLAQYENYTPLKEGTRLSDKQRERGQVSAAQLDRAADGKVRWDWKRNTSYLDQRLETRLLSRGDLQPGDDRLQLVDAATQQPVRAHGGSVAWNPWRQKFVMIFNQAEGKSSNLGEVWYAEAGELAGPWRDARQIVSHDKYTFYNPRQHPYFAGEDGRVIYFEGTYSTFFSGNTEQTPRYDYNQIMYRLDLAEPRLGLQEK